MNKLYGLRRQFLLVIVVAAVLSALVFFVADNAGSYAVERYFSSGGRHERLLEQKKDDLQRFITTEHISSQNADKLYRWQSDNPDVVFDVYLPDSAFYDSTDYEEEDALDGRYYDIHFADGDALLYLYWAYAWEYENAVTVAAVLLAAAVFLIICLVFINNVIRRIRTLSQEIYILEGGGLNYEISSDGNDEITSLADGLNAMRLAFLEIM